MVFQLLLLSFRVVVRLPSRLVTIDDTRVRSITPSPLKSVVKVRDRRRSPPSLRNGFHIYLCRLVDKTVRYATALRTYSQMRLNYNFTKYSFVKGDLAEEDFVKPERSGLAAAVGATDHCDE